MSILFFAGSLRAHSLNKLYAQEAQRLALLEGIDGEYIDIKNYPVPVYDGDIEASSGIPQGAVELGKKIRAASALVISTPEYNGSMPGMLKNLIDWISREKEMSLGGKHLLLLAASPGGLGGIRVLWHIRQPFEALGVHVFPSMMGLPNAGTAFDEKGQLSDAATREKLQKLLVQFTKHVGTFM